MCAGRVELGLFAGEGENWTEHGVIVFLGWKTVHEYEYCD
jgi:hypothetical protein